MSILKRIIVPFILLISLMVLSKPGSSQQKDDKGEIVMSEAELQSFIKRIASLKQQQIDRQQKEKLLNELEWAVLRQLSQPQQFSGTEIPQTEAQNVVQRPTQASTQDTSLKSQIQDINKRLDRLMQMMSSPQMQDKMNRVDAEEITSRNDVPVYPSNESVNKNDGKVLHVDTVYVRPDGSAYRIIKAAESAPQPQPENKRSQTIRQQLQDQDDARYRVDTVYIDRSKVEKKIKPTTETAETQKVKEEEPDRSKSETEAQIEKQDIAQSEPVMQKTPDTIYVYQDESGYRTTVSAGRNADVATAKTGSKNLRNDRANQSIIRKDETERIRVVQAPPQTIYLNQDRNRSPQPIIIYRDQRDPKKTERPSAETDSIRVAAAQQQERLEGKINNLESQINLLGQLLSGSEKNEQQKYNDDINRLKMQVSALTSELETARMKAADEKEKTEQLTTQEPVRDTALLSKPKSNIYKVYFANNSVEIPQEDFASLTDIVNEMKNDNSLMVLLRGFASSTGNAAYNEKIANQRAAAVQKWFLTHGVQASNLITQGRGVDGSKSEDKARRVEITLLNR